MHNLTLSQMIRNAPDREISLDVLFTEVSKQKSKSDKVATLREYFESNELNTKLLQFYIECLYHPDVKIDLPDSIPDYKVNDVIEDYVPVKLSKALTRVPYFCLDTHLYIENQVKREMFFIKTLEDLSAAESKLFARLVLRTINGLYPGVTDELLVSTFPELLPEGYKLDTKK